MQQVAQIDSFLSLLSPKAPFSVLVLALGAEACPSAGVVPLSSKPPNLPGQGLPHPSFILALHQRQAFLAGPPSCVYDFHFE